MAKNSIPIRRQNTLVKRWTLPMDKETHALIQDMIALGVDAHEWVRRFIQEEGNEVVARMAKDKAS